MADDNANSQPEAKKFRVEADFDLSTLCTPPLEDRLTQILRCTVCLDLSTEIAVYQVLKLFWKSLPVLFASVFSIIFTQCVMGHLICAVCLSHLLADARLRDEICTCPSCRCEITSSSPSKTHFPFILFMLY